MACVRRRRGTWVLDYRDGSGRRRWQTFRTKAEAEDALAQALPSSRQRHYPVVSADVTVAEYAERWLALCWGSSPGASKPTATSSASTSSRASGRSR